MSLIPNAPTLLQISTNDFINFGGVKYAIASIVSVTDNGGGNSTAVITIAGTPLGTVTLTLKNSDTILSNYVPDANGVQHAVWSQSVEA